MSLKFEEMQGDNPKTKDTKKPNYKAAPIDFEFEVGMTDTRLLDPMLGLPEAKDTLFVTKPIDNFEPYTTEETKEFKADPNAIIKKKFP